MAMPRYLTAQKISLLVLVKLYCNSDFPPSAKIPILSFIVSFSIPPAVSYARAAHSSDEHSRSLSIEAFDNVLHSHASGMPGRTLMDVFLKHMWEINSFDALNDLFDNIDQLLVRPKQPSPDVSSEDLQDQVILSKTSPLGVFVRKTKLEFTRLQFDDSMKLWSEFIKYRAPTSQWTKRLAGLASSGVDRNAAEMSLCPGDSLYDVAYGALAKEGEDQNMSVDDFDRMLEFQLDKLQRESIHLCPTS